MDEPRKELRSCPIHRVEMIRRPAARQTDPPSELYLCPTPGCIEFALAFELPPRRRAT